MIFALKIWDANNVRFPLVRKAVHFKMSPIDGILLPCLWVTVKYHRDGNRIFGTSIVPQGTGAMGDQCTMGTCDSRASHGQGLEPCLCATVEHNTGTVFLCDSRGPQGQIRCLCVTAEHHRNRYRVYV